MAAINWKMGDIDKAIIHANESLSLINDLSTSDGENESLLIEKVKRALNAKQSISSDLAYYYARRYEKNKVGSDAELAMGLVEGLLRYIGELSREDRRRLVMIDNYLFVICRVDSVDKLHKEKFIEFFQNHNASLESYLRNLDLGSSRGNKIFQDYEAYYNKIKTELST
jgi:hypothetical protein